MTDWKVDVVVVASGLVVWAHGAATGDPIGVNVGFLAVAAVVGTRLGWI